MLVDPLVLVLVFFFVYGFGTYVGSRRARRGCDHAEWKRMPLCDHARGSWRCLGIGCEHGVACSHVSCDSFRVPAGWEGDHDAGL